MLQTDAEIPAIHDDIMENLRIRYVITYVSSNPATTGPPRHIRVELVDPKTGEPTRLTIGGRYNGRQRTWQTTLLGTPDTTFSPGVTALPFNCDPHGRQNRDVANPIRACFVTR